MPSDPDAKWGLALHPKDLAIPCERTPNCPPTKKAKKTIEASSLLNKICSRIWRKINHGHQLRTVVII